MNDDFRWNVKTAELLRRAKKQESSKIQNSSRSNRAESEYAQTILALLKDPVSLGLHGAHSDRGHQR